MFDVGLNDPFLEEALVPLKAINPPSFTLLSFVSSQALP